MKTTLICLFISLTACVGLPTTIHSKTVPRRGVTGEECERPEHCEGGRLCVLHAEDLEHIPCDGSDACICLPNPPQSCVSSQDCEFREACTIVPEVEGPICVSAVIVGYTPDLVEIKGENPRPQVSDSSGLSFYPCKGDSTCKGDRQCLHQDEANASEDCDSGETCVCYPEIPQLCSTSAVCVPGEICAGAGEFSLCIAADVVAAIGFFTPTESIPAVSTTSPEESQTAIQTPTASPTLKPTKSPTVVGPSSTPESLVSPPTTGEQPSATMLPTTQPSASSTPSSGIMVASPSASVPITLTPSESLNASIAASISPSPSASTTSNSSGVCIDAEALAHLTADELVFSKHRWARVLCDESRSCATPGHMVIWDGTPMTMLRYCKTVKGCAEDNIFVNSPRFRVKLRLRSNTDKLVYTAFAARYETWLEESALKVLVHSGL